MLEGQLTQKGGEHGGHLLGVATLLGRASWPAGDGCVSEASCEAETSCAAGLAPAGVSEEGLAAF